MKYALYILFFFGSFSASAQVDSTKLYVKPVTLQARDWEAVMPLLTSGEQYEDVFTQLKQKFSVATPPSNTTTVTVDSVRIDALIGIYRYTQELQNYLAGNFTSRIVTALKAITNTYLRAQIAAMDDSYTASFINQRAEGRRRLRQIRL